MNYDTEEINKNEASREEEGADGICPPLIDSSDSESEEPVIESFYLERRNKRTKARGANISSNATSFGSPTKSSN